MFLVPKSDLFLDGFTYGEWTQFIAMLPGGKAQCVKRAWTPTIMSAIGLLLLVTILAAMILADLNALGRAMLWVAGVLQAPVVVELLTGSIWVVGVGPVMKPDDDGKLWRVFPCAKGGCGWTKED